ncbi:major facilitator superfamily domain-containing protein [Boeremia exigua]|uniref:major facilitator superfamily domain-containing protein n=1 Tax=Boeremia exigua TaxID=749465 RepID=UPI001E8E4BE9|nr:major facilitator superfamily domain-containing protein [Boeremia exigua]KAH6639609.1 major facilitator superfamily domain-containing protein [Boeremia exigua]
MTNDPVDVERSVPPSESKMNSTANSTDGANDQITVSGTADMPPDHGPLTNTRENLFMFFITLTQLVQMIPLGAGINSGLAIGEAVGATHIQSVWIVASYPLTQGAFVLIGGRLGAVLGHKKMFSFGCMWWTIWALGGGFSDNLIAVCFMRGLCGIGGGLMIPNIVALLGITFPPGKKRNLALALFGSMAPVGAAGGSLVSAVIVQLTHFKWMFFMLGMLGLTVYGTAIFLSPQDEPVDPNGKIDWVGAYLGVGGLILFNFVWNQAPLVGWDSPYEIALLIIAIIHFAAFAYWEIKVAKEPILPFNIWKAPSFGILMLTIFFSFMSLGIFFWYMNVYMITIRGDSLIRVGVQYLPLTIVGSMVAFLAAWLVPRVPAQAIIGGGCIAVITINCLLATIPADITYWAMAFPALFLSGFTIDLIVTSAQIIASNTVPMKHQGVAGSLVGTLLGYGMSTGLGIAGTVEVHTFDDGRDLLRGYHSAAYLGVGLAVAAFLMVAFFIRIPKDTREGWGDDEEGAARHRKATSS